MLGIKLASSHGSQSILGIPGMKCAAVVWLVQYWLLDVDVSGTCSDLVQFRE